MCGNLGSCLGYKQFWYHRHQLNLVSSMVGRVVCPFLGRCRRFFWLVQCLHGVSIIMAHLRLSWLMGRSLGGSRDGGMWVQSYRNSWCHLRLSGFRWSMVCTIECSFVGRCLRFVWLERCLHVGQVGLVFYRCSKGMNLTKLMMDVLTQTSRFQLGFCWVGGSRDGGMWVQSYRNSWCRLRLFGFLWSMVCKAECSSMGRYLRFVWLERCLHVVQVGLVFCRCSRDNYLTKLGMDVLTQTFQFQLVFCWAWGHWIQREGRR